MAAIARARSAGTPRRPATFLAVFAVSAAGLAFEIALTRVFSLYFQYHFAFLAVSLAVLGLSLGASAGYFIRRPAPGLPVTVLTALGAAYPLVTLALSWYPSAASVVPYAVLALIPFLLAGLFMALIFERHADTGGLLYAADLIGAAVGVIAVLLLLNLWSAFSMTLLLGVLVSFTALAISLSDPGLRRGRLPVAATLSSSASMLLLLANVATGVTDFHPQNLADAPRDKTMLMILADPARQARIARTVWSPFARVDVVETADPAARFIFTDGGAGSYMLRFDGSLDALQSWREGIEYLPFTTGQADRLLVIGAGGGKDILLGLLAGAHNITAVEVNPAVIEATRAFADYNGNILDLPQVNLVTGDARTFAERDTSTYDLIYLNVVYTQAAEPGSQVLVENYIFTWQAFQTYLNRLSPGGRLAIISHNALEASRAAVTALQALQAMGVPPAQALDHLMLWMLPAADATVRTSVLLVGREAFTAEVIDTFTANARRLGMQELFVPGAYEVLFAPLRDGMSLDTFAADDADYNLAPTSDDSPFFFHLDFGLPRPVQSALVTAGLLAIGLAALAFLMGGSASRSASSTGIWASRMLYAMIIGAAFMLVEIPLIQRFQLLLGYPVLSLAVVLSALLLGGGAGSLLSQRLAASRLVGPVMAAGLWIAAVSLIYHFALPAVVEAALAASLPLRIAVTVALTALLGVPMGIPFPSLIRRVGQQQRQVALIWALNGVFSVLGSTLALAISMTWGFGAALLMGAALYATLALLSRWALGGD